MKAFHSSLTIYLLKAFISGRRIEALMHRV